jgi:hypothetical protein
MRAIFTIARFIERCSKYLHRHIVTWRAPTYSVDKLGLNSRYNKSKKVNTNSVAIYVVRVESDYTVIHPVGRSAQ